MNVHPLKNNQYLDLDSHIDLRGLLELHDNLCVAIAKSEWQIGRGANGREDGIVDVSSILDTTKIHPELTIDQRARYLLLSQPLGHLGYSIRVIKNLHYRLKHVPTDCYKTEAAAHFTKLFEWLDKQDIFESYGRVVCFITPGGMLQPYHHDWDVRSDNLPIDEFIWLRTTKSKGFGLYSDEIPRIYNPIESYSAWFDNRQYHGGPLSTTPEYGFSIRIDGTFSKRMKNIIAQNGV